MENSMLKNRWLVLLILCGLSLMGVAGIAWLTIQSWPITPATSVDFTVDAAQEYAAAYIVWVEDSTGVPPPRPTIDGIKEEVFRSFEKEIARTFEKSGALSPEEKLHKIQKYTRRFYLQVLDDATY